MNKNIHHKKWIKVAALIVALVFFSQQVAWARRHDSDGMVVPQSMRITYTNNDRDSWLGFGMQLLSLGVSWASSGSFSQAFSNYYQNQAVGSVANLATTALKVYGGWKPMPATFVGMVFSGAMGGFLTGMQNPGDLAKFGLTDGGRQVINSMSSSGKMFTGTLIGAGIGAAQGGIMLGVENALRGARKISPETRAQVASLAGEIGGGLGAGIVIGGSLSAAAGEGFASGAWGGFTHQLGALFYDGKKFNWGLITQAINAAASVMIDNSTARRNKYGEFEWNSRYSKITGLTGAGFGYLGRAYSDGWHSNEALTGLAQGLASVGISWGLSRLSGKYDSIKGKYHNGMSQAEWAMATWGASVLTKGIIEGASDAIAGKNLGDSLLSNIKNTFVRDIVGINNFSYTSPATPLSDYIDKDKGGGADSMISKMMDYNAQVWDYAKLTTFIYYYDSVRRSVRNPQKIKDGLVSPNFNSNFKFNAPWNLGGDYIGSYLNNRAVSNFTSAAGPAVELGVNIGIGVVALPVNIAISLWKGKPDPVKSPGGIDGVDPSHEAFLRVTNEKRLEAVKDTKTLPEAQELLRELSRNPLDHSVSERNMTSQYTEMANALAALNLTPDSFSVVSSGVKTGMPTSSSSSIEPSGLEQEIAIFTQQVTTKGDSPYGVISDIKAMQKIADNLDIKSLKGKTESEIVKGLAERIFALGYEGGTSAPGEILAKNEANCTGKTMLFYVFGKALGLDVGTQITNYKEAQELRGPEAGAHIWNTVTLKNGKVLKVDTTSQSASELELHPDITPFNSESELIPINGPNAIHYALVNNQISELLDEENSVRLSSSSLPPGSQEIIKDAYASIKYRLKNLEPGINRIPQENMYKILQMRQMPKSDPWSRAKK